MRIHHSIIILLGLIFPVAAFGRYTDCRCRYYDDDGRCMDSSCDDDRYDSRYRYDSSYDNRYYDDWYGGSRTTYRSSRGRTAYYNDRYYDIYGNCRNCDQTYRSGCTYYGGRCYRSTGNYSGYPIRAGTRYEDDYYYDDEYYRPYLSSSRRRTHVSGRYCDD